MDKAGTIKVLGQDCEAWDTISAKVKVEAIKVDLPNIIVVEALPVDMLLGSDWRAMASVLYAVHANNDVIFIPEDEMSPIETRQHESTRKQKHL